MIVSVSLLSLLVGAALGVTIIAPLLLFVLFIRDWKKGDLW